MVRSAVDLTALVALPPAERLALVQALWDSLRTEPGALPVTDAQRALVTQRRAELDADPGMALDWETVRTDLWAEQDALERADRGARHREGGAEPPG